MTEARPTDLDDLRARIDRIDNAMADLLVERMGVIEAIGDRKRADTGRQIPLRPAREAQIIRRLAARTGSRFPAAALARMWHELLAAASAAQQPFGIAVLADQPEVWDLARDQFGSITPARRAETPQHALRLLAEDSVQLAVLPMPGEGESWWRGFVGSLYDTPFRVIGRLPLVPDGNHAPERAAMAVGIVPFEASGDDLTLVVLELSSNVSRARLKDLLLTAGMTGNWLASIQDDTGSIHLVEVSRFIGGCADALAKALAPLRHELVDTTLLGGYPRPFEPGVSPG